MERAPHDVPPRSYASDETQNRSCIETLSEFATIALWDGEDFLRPVALNMIEFHEALGMPLFWLDRSLLKNRNGIPRLRTGYFLMYALKDSEGEAVEAPEEFCHTDLMQRVDGNDFVKIAWNDAPPSGLPKRGHPNKEFFDILLRAPHIMCAIDVWAATHCGLDLFISNE